MPRAILPAGPSSRGAQLPMPLADLTTFAEGLIGEYVYFGPMLVLILCGFGLPLPEEVSLIAAGLLLFEDSARFDLMLAACMFGVIGGDAIPYTIGRVFGVSAMRYRVVRRLIHPRRFRRLERRFQAHRNWAVFSCRFFPGLRWPSYFLAGTMRMSVGRWLTLDLIGASIQVPLALHLGLQFGANVERLRNEMDQLHVVLLSAVLGLGLAAFGWRRWRHRQRSAARGRSDSGAAPPASSGRPTGLASTASEAGGDGREQVRASSEAPTSAPRD